jgi:hypothetical protein
VLSVGDSIADNGLEEGLEDTTGLLVDHYSLAVSEYPFDRNGGRETYWLKYASHHHDEPDDESRAS